MRSAGRGDSVCCRGATVLACALLLVPEKVHASTTSGMAAAGSFAVGWSASTTPGREVLIQSFLPGYVVLSVLISILGAACTLELLIRRTSNRGLWNLSLLVGAGFSFGSVSCFCLHFLGNSSLVLHRPVTASRPHPRDLTLSYDAGFTILSLIVSVVCMTGAFAVMGVDPDDYRRNKRAAPTGLLKRGQKTAVVEVPAKGGEDALKWKKGQKGSGLSRVERAKGSKMWQSLEGALAWTMVELPQSTRRSGPTSPSLPADKNARYAAEERERAANRAEEVGSAGDEDWSGRRRRSSGRRAAEEGNSVELSPRSAAHPLPSPAHEPSGSPNLARRASAPTTFPPVSPTSLFAADFTLGGRGPSPTFPPLVHQPSLPTLSTYDPHASLESVSPHPRRSPTPTASTAALLPRPASPQQPLTLYPPPAAGASTYAPRYATYPNTPLTPDEQQHNAFISVPPRTAHPLANRRASIPANMPSPVTRSIGRINSGEMTFAEFEASDTGRLEWIHGSESGLSEHDRVSMTEREGGAEVMDRAGSAEGTTMAKTPSGDSGLKSDAGRAEDEAELGAYFSHHLGKGDGTASAKSVEERKKGWAGRAWEYVTGDVTKVEASKVFIAGTTAGLGVAGMHYIGQRSITSIPHVSYSAGLVVASVVIACAAVVVGLWLMFLVLKPKLQHSWYKKLGVAVVLGSATALMHYTAMLSTTYEANIGEDLPASAIQTQTKMIIIALVSSLAILSCLGLFVSVALAQRSRLRHRSRRRRVVVACAIWDLSTGQILVTPDGMLPLTDIGSLESTDGGAASNKSGDRGSTCGGDAESVQSSVLDIDLTPSHPAFIASLRSTWFWRQPGAPPPTLAKDRTVTTTATLSEAVGEDTRPSQSMDLPSADRRRSSVEGLASAAPSMGGQGASEGSVARFLDRFSSAVAQLAIDVTGSTQGTAKLGVLFDRILTTGFITFQTDPSDRRSTQRDTVSKGQMTFIVNSCSTPAEKAAYTRRGFTFAAPTSVARVMGTALAVPVDDMTAFLVDVHSYAETGMRAVVHPGKIYAGLTLAQALPFEGLRIVVDSEVRHSLPLRELGSVPLVGPVRLASERTTQEVVLDSLDELGEVVASLAGSSLLSMMDPALTYAKPEESTLSDRVRSALVDTLIPLMDRVPRAVMRDVLRDLVILPSIVTLTPSSPSPAHLSDLGSPPRSPPSYLIVFRAILPSTIDFTDLGPTWTWQSFRLFRAQNESIAREQLGLHHPASSTVGGDPASESTLTVSLPSPTNEFPSRRPSKVQWSSDHSTLLPHATGSSTRLPSVPQSPPVCEVEGFTLPMLPSSPLASSTPTTFPGSCPTSQRLSHHPLRPTELVIPPVPMQVTSIYDQPSPWSESEVVGVGERRGIRAWDPMWLVGVMRDGGEGR